MAVTVLSSLARLGRDIARLQPGDVLAYGPWRIVLAEDDARPFWLEGRGTVSQVKRGKGAAAELRRRIKAHDATARS